jgi:hypothetical protein
MLEQMNLPARVIAANCRRQTKPEVSQSSAL